MKKITLILAILSLTGCAFIQAKKADIGTCWNDPDCKASAISRSEDYKNTTTTLVGLSPVPAAGPIAGSVVGYVSLLMFLMAGGSALNHKKEEKPA